MQTTCLVTLALVLPIWLPAQLVVNANSEVRPQPTATSKTDPFSDISTIFVAEIEKAGPAEGCGRTPVVQLACSTEVIVRVIEILKNSAAEQLRTQEFQATVPSTLGFANMQSNHWKFRLEPMRAAQRYLIMSVGQIGLQAAFESPRTFFLLTNQDDPVSDVRFILRWPDSSLEEQAKRASMEITQGPGHRSVLFAIYLNRLLATGSEEDTAPLVQTLEDSPPTALSNQARAALLAGLDIPRGHPSTRQLHLFVALTARYLLDAPAQNEPGEIGASVGSLLQNIHWVLGSEAARTALRGALPPSGIIQLRKKIANLRSGRLLSADDSADLERFVEAIAVL